MAGKREEFCTCSGRRNTTFPKTMTFPDSSNILANSTPWSSFSKPSAQIRTKSEYEIELFGISLSFALSLSIWASLRIFLASLTVTPYIESAERSCSFFGGLSPSSLRWSPVMLMALSFSRSLSPTGRDRNSGSLVADWFRSLRWRNRRKNPFLAESGDVMYSRWKFVFEAFGGTRDWSEGEEIGECSRVTDGELTLQPSNRRFASVFRSAIEGREFPGERKRMGFPIFEGFQSWYECALGVA